MSVVPQVGAREGADCKIRYFSFRRIISEVRLLSLEVVQDLSKPKRRKETLAWAHPQIN